MKLRHALILFASLSLCFVQAQSVQFNTPFHHLSFRDGLPRSEIYSVFQDSDGYIWFSTDAGVVKYDGYFFKVFGTDDGLLNNVVFEVVEDSFGRIWFVSLSNELCYLEDGKILPYKYNHIIKTHTGETTAKSKFILFDDEGSLYYSLDRSGLIKIDGDGRTTILHDTPGSYQVTKIDDQNMPSFLNDLEAHSSGYSGPFMVNHILEDSSQQIGPFTNFDQNRLVTSINDLSLSVISGNLVDLNSGEIIAEEIYNCVVDPHENDVIWLMGLYGVQKCIYKNGEIEFGEKHLSEERITDVCWDSQGGMWFSTMKNGVYYCSNFDICYATKKSGLFSNSVTGIGELDNDMWFSFYGGYQRTGTSPKLYHTVRFLTLMRSNNDHLIVSSYNSPSSPQWGRSILNVGYSRDILFRNEMIYYVYERLMRYNIETAEVDTLYDGLRDNSSDKQDFFRSVEVLPDNDVLIGGRFGLSKVENNQLINEYEWSRKFDVTDILYSDKFGLIAATNNSGVVFSSKGKFDSKLDNSTGLTSNKVRCLLELDAGVLLIGTNSGLNYISEHREKPNLIAENFGLGNSDILCLYANEKYVYLGTQEGVYRIEKSVFQERRITNEANVYLENVFVDGNQLSKEKFDQVMPYRTGRLKIRFRTTNYKNWVNKRYQYRLSKEEAWIDIVSPEIVIYKPLGEFDVEVRFLDDNNNWSSPTRILSCSVHVPFWKRSYFLLFVVFIIGLVMVLLMLKRQRTVKRRLKMENEMLSLEQKMQNARMNPHFVFNVLNSIHSFILFEDKKSAENYLIKFSELMRKTLNESIQGSIAIEDELSILNKYLELEQLRSGNSFEYDIVNLVQDSLIKIPTMLLQPIIENAVIHGVSSKEMNGYISIQLRIISKTTLVAEVFNNGHISEEQIMKLKNSGLYNAIGITKKRLKNYNLLFQTEQYNLNIHRVSDEQGGVKFTLTLPIID